MFDEWTRNRTAAAAKGAPVRTTIVVDDPVAAEPAGPDFDRLLGESQWRLIGLGGVEAELKSVPARPRRDELYLFGVGDGDMARIDRIKRAVSELTQLGVLTALITEDIPAEAADALLGAGAIENVRWPAPEGGFAGLFEKILERRRGGRAADNAGQLFTFFRASGGAGATTLAVNLGWELALASTGRPSVALIDLDLQFGGVSAYLDGSPTANVADLLLGDEVGSANDQLSAMVQMRQSVSVMPAPIDMVPLHEVSARVLDGVLANALASFDYVVVDTPLMLAPWTKTLIDRSTTTFFVARRLDANEAINLTKTIRAFEDVGAPMETVQLILNEAPGALDIARRLHMTRFEKSIGRSFDVKFPDGGESVAHAGRVGAPLAEVARRSPLRAALRDMAKRLIAETGGARHAGAPAEPEPEAPADAPSATSPEA